MGVSKTDSLNGFFVFQPEYVSAEVGIPSSPDSLSIEVYLKPELFRELWDAVGEQVRLVLFGTVAAMTSATGWSLSPYTWDVGEKEGRVKEIASFSFSVITRTATDTATMLRRDRDDEGPSAVSVRDAIEERHNPYGQMAHLSLKAVGWAETEGHSLGYTPRQTQRLAEEAIALIDNAHAGMRRYQSDVKEVDPERLWVHQNLLETFAGGRAALGHWEVGQTQLAEIARELINRPWLRVDGFEWAIVDALVFREVFEFGEEVKLGSKSFAEVWAYTATKGRLSKMIWQRLRVGAILWAIRWGIVAGGVWATWVYGTDGTFEWPTFSPRSHNVYSMVSIGFPIGKRAARRHRQTQLDLLQKMSNAYATLRQNDLLSPNQIRAALLAAQEHGALWDPAALALLDRAAQRDPPVWAL